MVEHVLGNLVKVGRDGGALEARLERGDGRRDEPRSEVLAVTCPCASRSSSASLPSFKPTRPLP
jgi:hypothetical protein